MSAATIEHTYRYAFASELVEKDKGERLQLATSGGRSEFPYFFQGQLKHPRLTAQLLRTLSKVVASRFHIPPAMLQKILNTRDPVVTSGGGLLRFEGFSACCSTAARVDVSPDGYEGVVVDQGTTNVDFNAGMRAALAQIRDNERVGLAVGTDKTGHVRQIDFFDGADPLLKQCLTPIIQGFKFPPFMDDEAVTLYVLEFPNCRIAERDTLHRLKAS